MPKGIYTRKYIYNGYSQTPETRSIKGEKSKQAWLKYSNEERNERGYKISIGKNAKQSKLKRIKNYFNQVVSLYQNGLSITDISIQLNISTYLVRNCPEYAGIPIRWGGYYHTEKGKKAISDFHKNRIHSKEEKDKISKTLKNLYLNEEYKSRFIGENNSGWKGGISKLPYPFEFDQQLKDLIRLRDRYTCQKCGILECECKTKLSIHHIDYNKENLLPNNLISLCRRCNASINYNREYWRFYFTSKVYQILNFDTRKYIDDEKILKAKASPELLAEVVRSSKPYDDYTIRVLKKEEYNA